MQRLGLRLASASARATSSLPRFVASHGTRKLHKLRSLPYSVEDGLGNFLPPDALKVQLDWQEGLLKRLNEEVAHTGEASSSLAQTIINLSGNKSKILAFNYASLAHNNDFFLQKLRVPHPRFPTHEHEIAPSLMQHIREYHGSIQQLRSTFSAAALGTFTNGWVWFVSDQVGKTSTITTYGPGTLLVRSRMDIERSLALPDNPKQSATPFPSLVPSTPLSDASTSSSFSSGDMTPASPSQSSNSEVSFMSVAPGLYSDNDIPKWQKVGVPTAGDILYPLFCVPMYEHAWMSAGYGVWGKERWLKEFWSVLNWQEVNTTYERIMSSFQSGSYS